MCTCCLPLLVCHLIILRCVSWSRGLTTTPHCCLAHSLDGPRKLHMHAYTKHIKRLCIYQHAKEHAGLRVLVRLIAVLIGQHGTKTTHKRTAAHNGQHGASHTQKDIMVQARPKGIMISAEKQPRPGRKKSLSVRSRTRAASHTSVRTASKYMPCQLYWYVYLS